MNRHHGLVIYWSDEDGPFVADVPELPGCMAHGDSAEDAPANAKEAMSLWIDTARESGRSVPEPRSRRLMFA
jgi:predicted RNase H-like HicB family nuclease